MDSTSHSKYSFICESEEGKRGEEIKEVGSKVTIQGLATSIISS